MFSISEWKVAVEVREDECDYDLGGVLLATCRTFHDTFDLPSLGWPPQKLACHIWHL
jgi:hypothetical protein